MNGFLQGFLGELVKVSFTVPTQRTSTAPRPTGGTNMPFRQSRSTIPRPPNIVRPGKGFAAAIPTQKLESPKGPTKPTGWRPDPAFRARPGSDPKPAKAVVKKRRRKATAPDVVPWETTKQYAQRSTEKLLDTMKHEKRKTGPDIAGQKAQKGQHQLEKRWAAMQTAPKSRGRHPSAKTPAGKAKVTPLVPGGEGEGRLSPREKTQRAHSEKYRRLAAGRGLHAGYAKRMTKHFPAPRKTKGGVRPMTKGRWQAFTDTETPETAAAKARETASIARGPTPTQKKLMSGARRAAAAGQLAVQGRTVRDVPAALPSAGQAARGGHGAVSSVGRLGKKIYRY